MNVELEGKVGVVAWTQTAEQPEGMIALSADQSE